MDEEQVEERCGGCGTLLDDETAFRIMRAGQSYCCLCYLTHDAHGKPLPVHQTRERAFAFGAPVTRDY